MPTVDRSHGAPVPPDCLEEALQHVRAGGGLAVPTSTRCVVISRRTLAGWERAGEWLLKAEGEGYRMRQGRGSVYLLPGQLRFTC